MALRRMVLRNFVVVSALDIDFQEGFTVLSGETGAGKSILIDALQLVLGARAEAIWVRHGQERAEIAAEFDVPVAVQSWLSLNGFENEGVLLLRRIIDMQGRSRSWINGSPATATQLRELGQELVDIHGQHAWQSLTRAEAVRDLLDAYAGASGAAVQQAWQLWRAALAALHSAQTNEQQQQRDRERLQWQLREADKLQPQDDEWAELNAQHARLSNAQTLQASAQQAWSALEEEGAASSAIHRAVQVLQEHVHLEPRFQESLELLDAAANQVEEAARNLNGYAQSADLEGDDLPALDARVAQWLSLARRYHQQPENLPQLVKQWRQELQQLEASADLQNLQKTQDEALARYTKAAQALSKQRAKAAPQLSKAITSAMQGLGMLGGQFVVQMDPLEEPAAHGLDHIQFLVAGHAGSAPKPIGKVASGGELSRISLAIAVTTSQLGSTPCLIFDEVDSGVGGAVAETVGKLMRQLGHDRQVLAVTHLPQVAACANHHLVVQKLASRQGASSTVQPISDEARVEEIARMLGGEKRTETTLAHATEMLLNAKAPIQEKV